VQQVEGTNETIIEIAAGEVGDATAKEVYRNLQVLYGTVEGELALDREFGISSQVSDMPQESARALLVAEYVRKTQKYEPRARVNRVEFTETNSKNGNTIPKVVIELV
jgi:hypothetical protein